MNLLKRLLLFVAIVVLVQYCFIRFVPNLIFAIAQVRKPQPLNTVIHAGKTDASLRKVVLPNPDFIYSACFYDVSDSDLVINGVFADTSQYCCLAFYDNTMQPYYVRNNLQGFKNRYAIRLSSVAREQRTLKAKTKKGVVLMRVLTTNADQVNRARQIQDSFNLKVLPQND